MLFLWDNSKYGLSVTSKLQSRLQFWVGETIASIFWLFVDTLENWVKVFLRHIQKVLKLFLLKSHLGMHHS